MKDKLQDPVIGLQSSEIALFRFLSHQIANKHLIDVGAHHGSISQPFLLAGWQVDAFEPFESNRSEMASRLKGFSKLRIHPEAISNTSGLKDFHLAIRPDGSSHDFYHSLEQIGDDAYHRKGQVFRIPVVCIDDLIACGRVPDSVGLLKIDTEGHDWQVLQGASRLSCEVISVEFWCNGHAIGRSPSPPEAMVRLLKDRGYRSYIVINHSDTTTSFQYSRLELREKDWGNIIFFNQRQFDLYSRSIHFCDQLKTAVASPANVLSILKFACCSEMNFLDVGASQGDFTAQIIKCFPKSKALLFESAAENYSHLRARFGPHSSVKLFNLSLGTPTNRIEETVIPVETLDHFLQIEGFNEKIDLIKARGDDPKVLKGAGKTIQHNQPMILLESVFNTLSKRPDSSYEILDFMHNQDYRLSSIYNIHLTQAGILGYADMLFVPSSALAQWIGEMPGHARFICVDPSELLNQNKVLQAACDERLALIHRLTETAEERLKLIEILDTEVKRLSKARRS